MKDKVKTFLELIRGLLKYPVLFIFVVVAFVLNVIQEITQSYGWIQIIQLIGIIIIVALCAVILLTDKNGKNYINKIGFFSFFLFASCIVLVDFSEFSFELLMKIITSYEFIFLGCLIPDFVSKGERKRDSAIQKKEDKH